MTIWIGFDTGFNTAMAVLKRDRGGISVVALKTVTPPVDAMLSERYAQWPSIQDALRGLRPDAAALEQPEPAIRSGRTAGAVLALFGCFAVACREVGRLFPGIPVIGVTPGQWKGSLSKAETQRILRLRHPDASPANEHEWDALGVCDWLADTWRPAVRKIR